MRDITVGIRAMRSSGLIPPAEPDPAAVAADHSYLG